MRESETTLTKHREFFLTGTTKNVDWRIEQLRRLRRAIEEREEDFFTALKKDLNKSPFEAFSTELGIIYEEIRFLATHLKRWAKPKRARTALANFKSKSYIYREPYGVALIMSPWNYPAQLTLLPLAGAIAGGNCAALKPSSYSPATSALIADLIAETFPPEFVSVTLGGREANKTLLEEKFDYIFFTGSVAVGKTVMQAAARHLTPVTLELGGKSPCIVDETARIDLSARRIAWGKFINAGQTCIAPDYILAHRSIKDALIERIRYYIRAFYGARPLESEILPRIVNEKHFDRLCSLIAESGRLVEGGETNRETLQIAPTVLDAVTWDMPVMQEEIFGPVLPVLTYDDLEEAKRAIALRPKPLALYYFTTDKKREKAALNDLSFGGGCINDTLMHVVSTALPFGGVGESGMGAYHGKASFETFTHKKSALKKSLLIDLPIRYAPYKNKLPLVRKAFK